MVRRLSDQERIDLGPQGGEEVDSFARERRDEVDRGDEAFSRLGRQGKLVGSQAVDDEVACVPFPSLNETRDRCSRCA